MDALAKGLQEGLSIRPANHSDAGFLASLNSANRAHLRLMDAERDQIEFLISEQQRYQTASYGEAYPNAMEFIVEKLSERIGRVVVNFGANFVHILDLSLLPQARRHGYGTTVLRALQAAAVKVAAPLTLRVSQANPQAARLYRSLGFIVEERQCGYDLMVWIPPRNTGGSFSETTHRRSPCPTPTSARSSSLPSASPPSAGTSAMAP
ncbi:MAG: GNAT family N-acetyltransferase [Magnetospirillum sp.]|nr:GNAT family N-acetyltransferase [Magnetospirillum sp.]